MQLFLKPVFADEGSELRIDALLDFSGLADDSGLALDGPVAVTGRVFNHAGVVELEGRAVFTRSTQCDRCCRPIEERFTCPLHYTLVRSRERDEGDETVVVEDDMLDLDELVRVSILLFLPSRHLCSPDCKGLCPSCGKDLNEGPCSCGANGQDA